MGLFRIASFALLAFGAPTGVAACTCVTQVTGTARARLDGASVVFRGVALEVKQLPTHTEMKGRRRYFVTFRVDQYWKGSPSQTVKLYELDAGTDCQGFGYQVGREYLVYAFQEEARDYRLEDYFWYGWTDVLPRGTLMYQTMACTPTGLTSQESVRRAIRELGPGKTLPLR